MKLMAFWYNDRFPWCLCGTVTEMTPTSFETKEFGKGYSFKRHDGVSVLQAERGAQLHADLARLTTERETELAKLNAHFETRLTELFARYGVERPRSITEVRP